MSSIPRQFTGSEVSQANVGLLPPALARITDHARGVFRDLPTCPKAIIAPYGQDDTAQLVTAGALQSLAGHTVRHVIILSPDCTGTVDGLAVPSRDALAMAGVCAPVLKRVRNKLLAAGLVHIHDAAIAEDAGLNAQLPYLTHYAPEARLLPVVVGNTTPKDITDLVDQVTEMAKGDVVFVLANALGSAVQDTAEQIETADPVGTGATGATLITGFQQSETGQGTHVLRLALSEQAGVGAWTIHAPGDAVLGEVEINELVLMARSALAAKQRTGQRVLLNLDSYSYRLRGLAATEVVLVLDGQEIARAASNQAKAPLVQNVLRNTLRAGFGKKTMALTPEDIERLDIRLTVSGVALN